MCAFSPDTTRPGETRKRDDVLVKWIMDEEGEYQVLYRAKPLSHSSAGPSKVSTAATLDAVGTLLKNPALNPGGLTTTDRVDDLPGLCLPEGHFLPFDSKEKPLDIPGLLVKAQDQLKATSLRRTAAPSFPVRFWRGIAPAGLGSAFSTRKEEDQSPIN